MARYTFNYYTEDYGSIAFDAPSEEVANRLLNAIQEGDMEYEDLPNYSKRLRGGDVRFDNLQVVEKPLPSIPILGLKTEVINETV